MSRKSDSLRSRRTMSMGEYLTGVRSEILENATSDEIERYRAAERSRDVYRAWNSVCGGTREGEHVTGLRYLPDSNKLLVYTDDAVWTQELMMLREIIRARMEREGAGIDGFIFKTSRKGYAPRTSSRRMETPTPPVAPNRRVLTPEEEGALEREVRPIEDERLRESLKKAMRASLEWKKGQER